MFDVLDRGGRLYLLDRDKTSSLLTNAWGIVHRHYFRDSVAFYTHAELVDMVRSAGFTDVRTQGIRKLFWKGKWYTSLVGVTANRP
jgi:hypothetical protein